REGDSLGRYELLSCVGRGGMATVWAARHHGAHGFSKIVALKTMLPALSDDPDFQRMFLVEARVAARIRHPNVVETLDLGEEDGLLYIVMEWIDGETLSAIMKRAFLQGGVSLAVGLKLIVDACAGAHAAHELCDDDNRPVGVVHRDVSPPNILVSYSGGVKLADFGVAKTIDINNTCTLAGQVKGKLRYMAPEQLLSAPIDRRTDIFALGISLYQLTTGRHPWGGETATETMHKILSEAPVSPGSFADSYPAELERIVLKSLARNPAERFQTAAEMALDIENFARSFGTVATNREVAEYVSSLLGPHGVTRRDALRLAIRQADARNVRDTAKEVRLPEHLQQARSAVEANEEGVPAEAASHAAEIVSVHPWTSNQGLPALSHDGGSVVMPHSVSISIAEFVSSSRTKGSKRALLISALIVAVMIAYTIGVQRGPAADVAIAAAPSKPIPALEEASPSETPSEAKVDHECAAASAEAQPLHAYSSSTMTTRQLYGRPIPGGQVRRPKGFVVPPAATAAAAHNQEPDVGF
ncbi:MAG TPA: serine/threonine-protein kinase, partial [Polyangiaceae bacterium]